RQRTAQVVIGKADAVGDANLRSCLWRGSGVLRALPYAREPGRHWREGGADEPCRLGFLPLPAGLAATVRVGAARRPRPPRSVVEVDAKPEPGRSQPGVGVQFRGSERGRGGMSDHVGGGGAAVGGGGCPDRRAGVRQGSAGRVRATADGMRIGDGGCPRESGGLNGGGSSDKHGWDPVSRAKGRRCWWVTWGRDPGVRRSGTLVSAQ